MNLDGHDELIIGSNNQNISIYNKIYSDDIYEFKLNECISVPYFGLNTKPDFYYENGEIRMLTGLSTGGLLHAEYESHLIGDINQDTIVNIQDVFIVVEYIIMNSNQIDYCVADINYDSYIDLIDILALIEQIVN